MTSSLAIDGAPLGLLQWTEGTTGADLVANAGRFESLGYHELWLPEIAGREPFAAAGFLLARTTGLRVSTGIANVYARDADAAAQGANTLAELSGGRFSLGLGVSHPVLVEPRGHQWQPPVAKMREYLARMKVAPLEAPHAAHPAPVIVAGHGPGLVRVAAAAADGSFLFLQPVEAVRRARAILGPARQLHVTVRCVLESDPTRARDLARRACAFYTSLPAYHARWSELGFEASDWQDVASDRLIDAICAWGDIDKLRADLAAYVAAGASHLVLYPCNPGEDYVAASAVSRHWHWPLLEALAR